MNWEQGKGTVERLVVIGITFAAGRGWIPLPGDMAQDVAAAVVTLISVLIAWRVNTPKSLVQAAASMPEVKKVVTNDRELARDIPSNKVVGG